MRHPTALLLLAALAAGRLAPAGAPDRLTRTRAALGDLEQFCARTGRATLYHRVPLLVGRRALADIARVEAREREEVLDYLYESCLRAKLAVLETMDGRRRPLVAPAAVQLGTVRFDGARCRQGGSIVFPVAAREAPASVLPFFATGELVRAVPAMAGCWPEGVAGTEVERVHAADARGRRVGWGRPAGGFVCDGAAGRPSVLIAIDHPPVREAIARDAAKALAKAAQGARPLYWSLGGGYFYTDYSAASAGRFVAWLAERYRTARSVNAAWDTNFERLGPSLMPTPDQAAASPARWRDWVAFNQWRLGEHVRWARSQVRRAVPEAPVGMAFSRYLFAGSLGLSGTDPVALGKTLDVVEVGGADAMAAELLRAVAGPRKPAIDAAVAAGPFGVLPHLLHGSGAVALRSWPQAPLRSLKAVMGAERALREALDARRLAGELAVLAQTPRRIALLYSQASMRLTPPWAIRCAESPHTRRLKAAWQAARFLDVGCGFLTSDEVAAERFGAARVIVVAGAPAEDEDVVRSLIDAVETGGHLVVLAESWTAGDYGREADYLLRLGVEVLETARPVHKAQPRPDRGGALDGMVATKEPEARVSPGHELAASGLRPPVRARGIVQKVEVNVRHEVLATLEGGGPAIVSFARGKGHVTYVAVPLAPEHLACVLRLVLARAGVEPLVRLMAARPEETWGIECRSAAADGRLLVSLWNTTDRARYVSLQAPPARSATNLSAGEALEVRPAGKRVVAGPLRLPPFDTVLVELIPLP